MTKVLFVWNKTNSMMGNDRWVFYGSLAVATYAKLTGVDVEILDRRISDDLVLLRTKIAESDLVVVTATTADLPACMETIACCNSLRVSCVVGGVHSTALRSELLEYANSVSILKHDGMSVINDIISDFHHGSLQSVYVGSSDFREVNRLLDELPPDRRLLPQHPDGYLHSLVTSMGCPNACTFCFDARTGTNRRANASVIEEIRSLGKGIHLGLFDDNIVGADPEGAKEFGRLLTQANLGVSFFGNADIRCVLYPEVLEALKNSGMTSIYIGLESVHSSTVRVAGKLGLVKAVGDALFGRSFPVVPGDDDIVMLYEEVIKKLHAHGLLVYCGLICGWPHETPDMVLELEKFAITTPDVPWLSIATPYPGTALNQMLEKQGISTLPYLSGKYDTNHLVFNHPKAPNQSFYDAIVHYYEAIGSEDALEHKKALWSSPAFNKGAVSAAVENRKSLKVRARQLFA
jgi:radical SAM superfamily enzyme YgiQ (UPF0313 family)